MKKNFLAAAAILVCVAAAAQEHHHMSDEEFLKMLASMPHQSVGTNATVATGTTVTINMTAQQFMFTPSTITVNQGDTLIINLSVPSNDGSPEGHGMLMEEYLTQGVSVAKGQTKKITINATTDGVFLFGCNQSNCGTGHSNMFGMLTVNKLANPAPTVAQIAPSSGPTTGGTAVTINGANFLNSSVTFGGVDAASVTVTSSTSIVAVTPPASAPGTVPVVVKNADGQSVTFSSFSYTLPGPAINAVSPATGPTSGGTTFTITGNGFAAGATVTVGGLPAGQVHFVNSTTITALSPFGPATEQVAVPVDVVVTNPDGTRITKTRAFQYFAPPLSVSSLSPSASLPAGGVDVTITGAGFTTAVTSSVTFGGVAGTSLRVIDPVTMHVTAPAHAAGSVDVVVTVGSASVTRTNGYTYGNPPPRKRAAGH